MTAYFRRICLGSLLGVMAVAAGQVQAAATILLWPIDPWLAADAKATELWIQNQGNSPTTMQVRIVRWKQEGGFERYSAQQDVVASPPIVTIAAGSKQLIRLIKQGTVPVGVEQAYRIIVDEIPQPDNKAEPAIGLKLQMRYSIPLFVYGQGIPTSKEGAHHAFVDTHNLSWRVKMRADSLTWRLTTGAMYTSGSVRFRWCRAGRNVLLLRDYWATCWRAVPAAGPSRPEFGSQTRCARRLTPGMNNGSRRPSTETGDDDPALRHDQRLGRTRR